MARVADTFEISAKSNGIVPTSRKVGWCLLLFPSNNLPLHTSMQPTSIRTECTVRPGLLPPVSLLHRKLLLPASKNANRMSKLQLLKDSRTLVRLIIATVIESSKAKCVWYEFLDLVSCMFYSNSNSLWSKYRRQKQCNSRSSLHFGLCFVLKIHLSEWTENATSRGPQLGGKLRYLWTCSFH